MKTVIGLGWASAKALMRRMSSRPALFRSEHLSYHFCVAFLAASRATSMSL